MDGKSDFEQQFTQNIKASTDAQSASYAPAGTSGKPSNSKLAFVIAIALGAILLVETIAFAVFLVNNPSTGGEESEDDDSLLDEDYSVNNNYVYDNNDFLVAMNLTCTSESGAQFVFSIDGKYQELSSPGNLTSFGTYTVKNDSLVALNGSNDTNKVLYYNDFDIADGLTIYVCEEPSPDSTNSTNTSTDTPTDDSE